MNKVVYIIGTAGIPACYGGFESLVENLTRLSPANLKYKVFCSSKLYEKKIKEHNRAELIYLPISANGISSIFYDIISLIYCLFKKPDAVLILGVSGCIFLPIYSLFSNSKIITNIDGLEWKRDKWNQVAKKFLKLSEKIAVKFSDVIICDNQAIGDYVKSEYNISSEIIAYGGDHVLLDKVDNTIKDDGFYFGLCRIEPENNVEMILKSFSEINEKLIFVGNWNNSNYGGMLKEKYSKYSNIKLLDPIYDISKLYYYRSNCIAYIHGHSAGGTNPSLVEAMFFAKPIFAFDCSFNRYSTKNQALYFSSSSDIINLINIDFDSKNTGDLMLALANENYKWLHISNKYSDLY